MNGDTTLIRAGQFNFFKKSEIFNENKNENLVNIF